MARRARKRIGATAGGWPGRGMAYWLPRLETACGVGDDLCTRAAAASSLFKREGHALGIMPAIALIQPLAPDRGYLFWWGYRRRGSHGGGGSRLRMRRASSGPAVTSDAML